jgi:hypothetical protein
MAAALSCLLPQCGGYERSVPRYALTRRVARWGRSLAIATAAVYVISSALIFGDKASADPILN